MELAAWLNYLPDLKKGSRAAPRPVQTPGCPSVSHCMSAFHACHRISSVLCPALLTNSPSITGTSWLSARHLAKQQRVTSIGMRGIHPALGRQCSRAVTMGKKKIQSSNPGIPESRPRGGWKQRQKDLFLLYLLRHSVPVWSLVICKKNTPKTKNKKRVDKNANARIEPE